MKTKTLFMIPMFAAVFALMFVAATPHVIAEPGQDYGSDKWKDSERHHKKHKAVEVQGFVGSIPVPEEMSKEAHKALKDQVTVSLSQAADGLDVMKGGIAIAVNENGEKFVVWKLVSVDMSGDSETVTKTIHVVDAGDSSNSVSFTKEYDPSMKDKKHGSYDQKLTSPEKIEEKIQKIEKKLNEGTLNQDMTDLKIKFVYLLRQLQTAINNGDEVQADSLRDQLKDLRNQMIDLKKFK